MRSYGAGIKRWAGIHFYPYAGKIWLIFGRGAKPQGHLREEVRKLKILINLINQRHPGYICTMPVSQNIKVAVDAVVFGYTSKEGLSVLSIKRNIN
ncbi:hypothetical protein A0256_22615 [Mucilaginibacter sp. PAMC 26640]|nr:hypothetical protein A0256_22615 [Mucilaginibacter sp. PAMC 26640]